MAVEPDAAGPSSRSQSRLLWLWLALLAASWLGLFADVAWRQRDATRRVGLENLGLHATFVEQQITQALVAVDITADSMRTRLLAGATSPATLGDALGQALRPMPFVRSLSLADAEGRVFASSQVRNLGQRISLDDTLPPAQPARAGVLHLGLPAAGRDLHDRGTGAADASEHHFVPALRSIQTREGVVWMVVVLNPDFVIDRFALTELAETAHVQWMRYDGVLLASSVAGDRPGSRPASPELEEQLARIERGELMVPRPGASPKPWHTAPRRATPTCF